MARSTASRGLGMGQGAQQCYMGVQGAVASKRSEFSVPWGALSPWGFCTQNPLSSCLTVQIPGLSPAYLGRCVEKCGSDEENAGWDAEGP